MGTIGVTEPAFFVLTALVGAPRHGYGIIADVEQLSEGRVRLRVGTLYGVLDRLVADGLIELDREEITNGRLRRYFRLSDAGRDVLVAETGRLAANARVAAGRLESFGPRRPGTVEGGRA